MTEQIVAAPYEAFKGSLKGQTVTIPSIYTLIPEWQPDLHEEYERARDEALDPWIRRWCQSLTLASSVKWFLINSVLDGWLMSELRDPFLPPTLVVLLRFGYRVLNPIVFFAQLRNTLLGSVLFFGEVTPELMIFQYFLYDDSMRSITYVSGKASTW